MYQVMARGDRWEGIVRDEQDGRWFESTWGQVVESSGWMRKDLVAGPIRT
jgi:hypothetical protein